MESTEIDIYDLVETIFRNPYKNPREIMLDLRSIVNIDSKDPINDLFKILLMIFTRGTKILYGNDEGIVNLEELTHDNFLTIKLYFNSFGFDIMWDIQDNDQYENIITEKKELKDYYLRVQTTNKIYYISFDTL